MDTQPVDYLKRLAEQGGTALLFVVPEERVDSVWAELLKRASKAGNPVANCVTAEGVRSGTTASGASLQLTSWKRLLSSLRSACERLQDREAAANIDQLAGLVRRFEDEGTGPMNAADLTDLTVPRRVRSLASLVQAVVSKGLAEGLISIAGTRPTHDWTSAGRYLSLPHGNGWLGLDHDAWARYQVSPLWLFFSVCRATG